MGKVPLDDPVLDLSNQRSSKNAKPIFKPKRNMPFAVLEPINKVA